MAGIGGNLILKPIRRMAIRGSWLMEWLESKKLFLSLYYRNMFFKASWQPVLIGKVYN